MKMNVSSKLAGFFFFFRDILWRKFKMLGIVFGRRSFHVLQASNSSLENGKIINSFFLIIRICTFRGNSLNLKILLKIVLIIS